jgi:hypothetical protein
VEEIKKKAFNKILDKIEKGKNDCVKRGESQARCDHYWGNVKKCFDKVEKKLGDKFFGDKLRRLQAEEFVLAEYVKCADW